MRLFDGQMSVYVRRMGLNQPINKVSEIIPNTEIPSANLYIVLNDNEVEYIIEHSTENKFRKDSLESVTDDDILLATFLCPVD